MLTLFKLGEFVLTMYILKWVWEIITGKDDDDDIFN